MGWPDVVGEIFKFLTNLFITPKKQIQKVVKIYDTMNRILEETVIQRCLVFKVHNTGGLIRPTTELFASVLYEDYRIPFTSVKEGYQRLPVDKEYIKMILDVMEKKKDFYETESIPNGMLRDIYVREGVRNSIIYFIGQDRRNMYFCSVGTDFDSDFLKKQGISIDIWINIIKQNIK